MTSETPWVRIEPDAVASGVLPDLPQTGLVLVRVAPDPTPALGEVVLQLGHRLRDGGARVFLCDGSFESPFLGPAAGITEGEGVSDALLWGASFRRISHRLGEDLHLAPAGTVVADGAGVRAHPRWRTILEGFREVGAVLVVALPELPPEGSPLAATEVALRLELVADGTPPEGGAVAADRASEAAPPGVPQPEVPRTEPEIGGGASAIPGASVESGDPSPPEAGGSPPHPRVRPLSAEALELLRRRTPSAGGRPGTDPPPVEALIERTAAPASQPRSRTRLLLLLLLLVVAALLAAGWYGLIEIPGVTPVSADAGTPVGEVMVPAPRSAETELRPPSGSAGPAAPSVVATSPKAAWVLALGAFQDRATALREAGAVRSAAPGYQLLVVPVELDGALYHRILAGPAGSAAEAEALRFELPTVPGLSAPEGWRVRGAGLAFQLGEVEELEAARDRARLFEQLGISTHLMEVAYSDGSTRVRVYAGAFATEAEAAGLRTRLVERGLASAPLVDRIGRAPE